MADFNGSTKTGKSKRLPEWVPDWTRITEGEPFHFDGMDEKERHKVQVPIPAPILDDDIKADEHGSRLEKREALQRPGKDASGRRIEGYEPRYLKDDRPKEQNEGVRLCWVHPELRRRAELINFKRHDSYAAQVNAENAAK